MLKLSIALAALGLALLGLSALPGRAAAPVASQTAAAAASGAGAPADVAYGRALFIAKGCVACHRHRDVANSGAFGGDDVPNLSTPRWNADYLRAWLKDPAAVKPGTAMPTLGLRADEIEALIAFLGAGKS